MRTIATRGRTETFNPVHPSPQAWKIPISLSRNSTPKKEIGKRDFSLRPSEARSQLAGTVAKAGRKPIQPANRPGCRGPQVSHLRSGKTIIGRARGQRRGRCR
jgi:hypothetical protein